MVTPLKLAIPSGLSCLFLPQLQPLPFFLRAKFFRCIVHVCNRRLPGEFHIVSPSPLLLFFFSFFLSDETPSFGRIKIPYVLDHKLSLHTFPLFRSQGPHFSSGMSKVTVVVLVFHLVLGSIFFLVNLAFFSDASVFVLLVFLFVCLFMSVFSFVLFFCVCV